MRAATMAVMGLFCWSGAAAAQSDAEMRSALLGSWAPDLATCSREKATFSADGRVQLSARQPKQGTYDLRGGSITTVIDGRRETNRIRIGGGVIEVLRNDGTTQQRLVRCPEAPKQQAGAGDGGIVGVWAASAAKCSTEAVSFGPDGSLVGAGPRGRSGRYQLVGDRLSTTFDGRTESNSVILVGNMMTVLRQDNSVAQTLFRCAGAAVPNPAPAPAPAPAGDLRASLLGGWAETPGACATDKVTFGADGSVSLTGPRRNQGSFLLEGDTLVVQLGGRPERNPIEVRGNALAIKGSDGRLLRTMVRCDAPAVVPAPQAPGLAEAIVGRWAESTDRCTSDMVDFSRDGRVLVTGRNGIEGTYKVSGDEITVAEGSRRPETNKARIEGGKLVILRPNGTPAKLFVRCEDKALQPAAPPASTRDAILLRQMLGTWSDKAECKPQTMTLAEGGVVRVTGMPDGSYTLVDGVLTATVGGKTERARVSFDGDRMVVDDLGRKQKLSFFRCSKPGDAALGGPGDSATLRAVRQLVSQVVEEQKVFLNCSATLGAQYGDGLVRGWRSEIEKARALLQLSPETRAYIAEFERSTAPESLMMRDARFSEVITFCNAHPKWSDDYSTFRFTVLSAKLRVILGMR